MQTPAARRRRQAADPLHALDRGALTAGGLYLATGSPAATLIGTAAWAALAGWKMWLSQQAPAGRRSHHSPASERLDISPPRHFKDDQEYRKA